MDRSKLARNLLNQREQGVSLAKSAQKSWPRLLFRLAIILLGAYFYFAVSPNPFLVLGVGIVVGATLQDAGWIWKISGNWSFTEEVVNWERVQEIAKES
jgi:hypothetical protein